VSEKTPGGSHEHPIDKIYQQTRKLANWLLSII